MVCTNPARAEIDLALVRGVEATEVAASFGISVRSVRRHKANHVPTPALREGAIAVAEEEALTGAELLRRAGGFLLAAQEILGEARTGKDPATALRAIRTAGRMIETCAKLTGDIDSATTVNVLVAPALQALQHVILCALAPFPAARQAVVVALSHMAGDGDGGSAPLTIAHDPAG